MRFPGRTLSAMMVLGATWLAGCAGTATGGDDSSAAVGSATESKAGTSQSSEILLPLRINLQIGQKYRITTHLEQVIERTIADQTTTTKQATTYEYLLSVKGVDEEGNTSMDVTYDRIHYKQGEGDAMIEFDSRQPAESPSPLVAGLAGLSGKSFTAVLSPDGKVVSATGVEEILEQIIAGIPEKDGASRSMLESHLRNQHSGETLLQNFENVVACLPPADTATGGSWTRDVTIYKGLPLRQKKTLTLESREGGRSRISSYSEVSPNMLAEPIKMGAMLMRYELNGTQEGELMIDDSTGLIAEGTVTQKYAGNVFVQTEPPKETPDSWPMTMTGTLKITSAVVDQ